MPEHGVPPRAASKPAPSYRSLVMRYGLAVVTAGAAIGLMWPLRATLQQGFSPPLLLAVAVSAMLAGVGPGLLAALLTSAAADFLLYPPYYELAPLTKAEFVRQLLFAASALPIALLGGALRQGRKRAESERAALRESETLLRASDTRYRTFLDQTAEGIWRFELQEPVSLLDPPEEQIEQFYGRAYLAECNEALARMYGATSADDLIGARLSDFLPDDAENRAFLRAFIENHYRALDAESQEVDRTGAPRFFLNNLLGIIENGAVHRLWGSQRDITARKQAENALRQSEARYRALIEAATQVVWTWDHRGPSSDFGGIQEWWEEMTGQPVAEQRGLGWLNAVHPDDRERTRKAWIALLAGERYDIEYRVQDREGGYRYVWARATPIRGADGELQEFVGMSIETTARHRAEEALRASELRLRRVLESDMMGIGFWNGDFITGANDALLRLLDYDWVDLAGGALNYERVTPPGYEAVDRRAFEEGMMHGAVTPYEKELVRKDGTRVPVLIGGSTLDGNPRDWVFFVLDLTDRRRTEEQLQAAQRLETIGRLAGGIAHEANNQMSVVLGATHFLLLRTDLTGEVRDDIEHIRRAAEHTGAITRQLLAFSRRQVLQPEPLDLNMEVRGLEPVIQRTLGAQSRLELQLAPEVGLVRADQGQLSQVLLNLVLNARDAMGDHGTLTIATTQEVVDKPTPSNATETVLPGTYGVLTVTDTGHGMDRETLSRVFEPFFTTKPLGDGTGLGLSTVHGIVRQSGGYITVDSAPNQGATFRVYLPLTPAAPTPRHPAPELRPPSPSATVLLVDDQAPVRAPLARALREEGYTVLEAGNAHEALAVATRDNVHVDLVVSDIIMPEMFGSELAHKLAEFCPGVPILFTSGYADEEMRRRGLLDAEQPFLQKPYSPEVLTTRVRQLLERGR